MSTLIKGIVIVWSLVFISACGGSSATKSEAVTIPKAVNVAPVANIPAGLEATGNEVVTMDGSNSNDPDGTITNYDWMQTSGINVVITNTNQAIASFTAPNSNAQLGFQLTVTDNEGATNTQTLIVTTEEAPVIVDNLAPVANAGSDQRIVENTQVSLDGSSSNDSDGTIVSYSWVQTAGTPTVSITESTLAVASFTAPDITTNTPLTFELTVTDDDGAVNSSSVVTTIILITTFNSYPELNSSEGLNNPSLAYGLTGVQDWYVGLPYLDIMKMSREWIGHLPAQWGGITYEELQEGGYLDEHGWPTAIPVEAYTIQAVFAWEGNEYDQGQDRRGEYILTYEGDGDIQLSGIQGDQIISTESGRIVFNINNNQGVWGVNIFTTDPNSNGNYIRNIKIIKQDRLDLYNSGAIFNPDWLKNIRDSRQVRFMDMMNTNNSTITTWSEINSIEHVTWNNNTPIEVLVRLANEIGADPWFNMPFHADDNYVRQFAEFIRDNLDSNLVAHVEFSNEVWNWAFQQTHDSSSMAISLWNLDPNNAGGGWVNYYGKRASEVMKVWTDVFGTETESRLKRIAGTQTDNPWISEQVLTAPMWEDNDPNNYTAPHLYFDALSPTTYFGGTVISEEGQRNALFQAMDDTNVDNYDFHYRLLKGEINGFENIDNTLSYLFDSLRSQRVIADNYNLNLIAYEGGQHVHHSAFIDIPDDALQSLQEHLEGFVRSQQMADLYEELWNEWRLIGTGPFMSFTDHGVPTQYGSWGLRASLSDSNPRVNLLESLNSSSEAWWESRGGQHFQQGLISYGTESADTLVGTPSEDYLIGSDGNDTFYPGLGNDGINGGAGNDIVLFKGNLSDYTYFVERDGYRIVGPEGSDYIFDVEELQFEDSKLLVSDINP